MSLEHGRTPRTVDRSYTVTGPRGERAHRSLVEHGRRFDRRVHRVTDRVYCLVGNGLANTTWVVGEEGVVVIDTGESNEEAALAMRELSAVTDKPVRGVLYTHHHYVAGTEAVLEGAPTGVEIWAHERVTQNRARSVAELGPTFLRRLACQFGLLLPTDGEDAMPNLGIGPFFFNPDAPGRTDGFVPPTHTVNGPTELVIAGIRFWVEPAVSDSDDTLIVWLPDDDVAVNNHVWPALFNIYPLRGESYRDPLAHVEGIDRIRALDPAHLVGVHGPPIGGRDAVRDALRLYRDTLQLIWDQTVRGMNQRLGPDDLVAFVSLPTALQGHYLSAQHYGLVEFHVRQIHNGLMGWFDEDPAHALPVSPEVEAERLVAALGGRDAVLGAARAALGRDEASWSAQLASYLLRLDRGDADARSTKAAALRLLGQTTTSANLRSFCLTHARELEGQTSLDFFTPAMIPVDMLRRGDPRDFVRALRVQVDPERAAGLDTTVAIKFIDRGTTAGLHLRHGLAAYLEPGPEPADVAFEVDTDTWAGLYTGSTSLRAAVAAGHAAVTCGSVEDVEKLFDVFDHTKLA